MSEPQWIRSWREIHRAQTDGELRTVTYRHYHTGDACTVRASVVTSDSKDAVLFTERGVKLFVPVSHIVEIRGAA